MTKQIEDGEQEFSEKRATAIDLEMNASGPAKLGVNLLKPHATRRREADKREAPPIAFRPQPD